MYEKRSVTVTISASALEMLNRYAEEAGLNRSETIEQMIEVFPAELVEELGPIDDSRTNRGA